VSGKPKDIKYQIAQCKEDPDIIIWDVPRSAKSYINYVAMEEIKGGVFCSTKYETKPVIINWPHVLCFANFEPEYDKMSKDRWNVTKLEGKGAP